MSQYSRQIAALIQEIAEKARKTGQFPIMSGKVVAGSVDEGEGTCNVQCSIREAGHPTEGVLLNPVSLNNNGLILYPADDSEVVVGEVDGPGRYVVLKCSNVRKMVLKIGGTQELVITNGEVVFNGGSNQGMVKVTALVGKLNVVEGDLNNLKLAFAALLAALAAAVAVPGGGAVPVTNGSLSGFFTPVFTAYAAAMITPTIQSNIENPKVKH